MTESANIQYSSYIQTIVQHADCSAVFTTQKTQSTAKEFAGMVEHQKHGRNKFCVLIRKLIFRLNAYI